MGVEIIACCIDYLSGCISTLSDSLDSLSGCSYTRQSVSVQLCIKQFIKSDVSGCPNFLSSSPGVQTTCLIVQTVCLVLKTFSLLTIWLFNCQFFFYMLIRVLLILLKLPLIALLNELKDLKLLFYFVLGRIRGSQLSKKKDLLEYA